MKLLRLLILALTMWSGLAYAAPVTYYFGGTLNSVFSELAPHFSVGSPFSGSFTFDSNSPDSDPDPLRGVYSPGPAFSANINGISFSATGSTAGSVQVDNISFYGSRFSANAAISGPALNNYMASSIFLDLIDVDVTAFVNDALPLGGLNLGDFEATRFMLVLVQSSSRDPLLPDISRPTGSLSYISLTDPSNNASVPEPDSVLLVALGLGALAAGRRKAAMPDQILTD